ncbi:MAG: triose-phosphate isomerase, partial [Gemmatimonadaceae bacterium]|nr:triose-phosphate isomerase [Gemmatimonadaceae bacterium]
MTFARPFLAANWKMNLGPTAAATLTHDFLAQHSARPDRTIVLFPSALAFAAVKGAVASRGDVRLGVQNVHAAEKGAFTG